MCFNTSFLDLSNVRKTTSFYLFIRSIYEEILGMYNPQNSIEMYNEAYINNFFVHNLFKNNEIHCKKNVSVSNRRQSLPTLYINELSYIKFTLKRPKYNNLRQLYIK